MHSQFEMTQEEGGVFAARQDAVRTLVAEMLGQTGQVGAADCSLGRERRAAVVVMEGNLGCLKEAAAQGCFQVCGDSRV